MNEINFGFWIRSFWTSSFNFNRTKTSTLCQALRQRGFKPPRFIAPCLNWGEHCTKMVDCWRLHFLLEVCG